VITNEQLTQIKERAEKYAYGVRYHDSADIFAGKSCEDIPQLVAEIERLRKALSNIEKTTESNAYHGLSVEATMRNRAHKALHGVEPEEV